MDQTFYKKLAGLMIPIMFQNLMLASVAVADAIMLGSVEQNSMAAVSLATQIQFIQNMFLGAIVASVAILGAQYWGKGPAPKIFFCDGTQLMYLILYLLQKSHLRLYRRRRRPGRRPAQTVPAGS